MNAASNLWLAASC